MSSEVPFHVQTAVLDRYIHSPHPTADPEAIEVILEMLRSRQDLRNYFFQSGPGAAWAPILWDQGFFQSPPPPEETGEGSLMLPRWDVQEHLITVADQVPDIVLKHVETVQAPGWYLSRAIRALCAVPAGQAIQAAPKVEEWLRDPVIATVIAPEAYDLIAKLAEEGEHSAALDLYRELMAPVPRSDVQDRAAFVGGGAACKFRGAWNEDQILACGIDLFGDADIESLVALLEDHLCAALEIEAAIIKSPEFEFSPWWRTAIEETGQDTDTAYRDRLLTALRDAIEGWVERDAPAVEPLIQRYLGEEHRILRRVGFHMLQRFPSKYEKQVTAELDRAKNLDDGEIHHEYFMLLQRGYPLLDAERQEKLVAAICRGPAAEQVHALAERAEEEQWADREEFAERYPKRWICDRLWMTRDHLTGEAAKTLHDLVDELGEPEHPSFLIWTTGGFQATDASPITEQQVSDMTPEDLITFLIGWRPDPARRLEPERHSYRGLARAVAGAVVANPLKYEDNLAAIALHRPEFASSLLRTFHEDERAKDVPWSLMIGLCQELLANEEVCQDMQPSFDRSWIDVRRSITRLMELGLDRRNPERAIAAEHLPDVQSILLTLLDDPDPAGEPSPETWTQRQDPATGALNYVRPSALRVLVHYAVFCAQLEAEAADSSEPKSPGPKRLKPDIEEALTRKLDRSRDPSWAVHSVYGRHLGLLYWLDQKWVETHIDGILPEDKDERSSWLFVAAWDSFINCNHFWPAMLELLRPKYRLAIHNLHRGYATSSLSMPSESLATHLSDHLVWEYLLSDYNLDSPEGQESLIAAFFRLAPPDARSGPAWSLWRIAEANPPEFEEYWSKARRLWEWRVREASASGHSTDFDGEMRQFARLLLAAPKRETIASLWPLLEGLLPHITRTKYRDRGRDAIEKYLALKVEDDPVRAIQLYRLMHDQLSTPGLYYSDEARKILETAASLSESRQQALDLIDMIYRWGNRKFVDILERYVG